ncbi:hypothetical protein ABE10_01410, partial [Bacillus toyonensis]|nr:hypothetical protein [Bacillus toyonensis]
TRPETTVVRNGFRPGNALRGRDMPRAQSALLRVRRGAGAFAAVLLRGTDVDERAAEVLEDVVLVRAEDRVVAFDDRVLGRCGGRDLGRDRPPFGDPAIAAAVEQADVLVAEEREDPERVGGPPVVLVAIDHDRVVTGDALAAQQRGEAGAVDIVAHDGVVQLGVPVDLDRAGDVARLVQQDVLVGLDDHESRSAQTLLEPGGRHEASRLRILGELCGRGVEIDGHSGLLGVGAEGAKARRRRVDPSLRR